MLKTDKHICIAQIYVDDIVFGATHKSLVDMFVEAMKSTFEMSMIGELTYFLGLQVKQQSNGLFLNQSKYAKNLVKRFGLEGAKPMKSPMCTSTKLCKGGVGDDVDPTLYRSMIGSLLYLSASRPNIQFAVCMCARFQSEPKTPHLNAVKRILRYVSGTIDIGIWYTRETNLHHAGFSDSDWAGDIDDRRSTSGGCFYLGNNLISWFSRKRNYVSLSTAEAEYVAAASCATQLLWLKSMLSDYCLRSESLMLLLL